MQLAGKAIADAVERDFLELADWPSDPRFLVLAGKGHNAGDALIAVRHLCANRPDAQVMIVWAEAKENAKPHVQQALSELEQVSIARFDQQVWSKDLAECLREIEYDVVFDGLLGLSFSQPLRTPYDQVIEWANQRERRFGMRIAVDLPSGIGDQAPRTAFRADFTYATGLPKTPMEDERNAEWVGRPKLLDLGFFKHGVEIPEVRGYWLDQDDALRQLQHLRPADGHKYTYGQVAVIAGSPQYPGAALMCMGGALRSGSGLVTGIVPNVLSSRLALALPEATWLPVASRPDGSLEAEVVRAVHMMASHRTRCVVMGPGLIADRNSLFNITRIVREVNLPQVLDASALTPEVIPAVLGRQPGSGPVILTPHPGELNRIFDRREGGVELGQILEFCQRYRLMMAVKGRITRVCDGQRVISIAAGGPVLSRGGTGDILAGMIGGLVAQDPENCLGAVLRAIAWHGAAGDALAHCKGQTASRTTELLDYLPVVLRQRTRRA